jgi:hypothetical protein
MKVGFIVDDCVPSFQRFLERQCGISSLIKGWASGTSVYLMRYLWISRVVNSERIGVKYELYRPGNHYDIVVFLKSMGVRSQTLVDKLHSRNTKVVFDCNVDYFTQPSGEFFYEGMAPSSKQQADAVRMATICDALIGDSSHIVRVASPYCRLITCITDNVRDEIICAKTAPEILDGKLVLLWSGEAVKLFDLLAIEEVLRAYADRIILRIVTNSLDAVKRWYEPYRQRFQALMSDLPHKIIPFTSIETLMQIYDDGGLFISPRHLNNSYNLGHTEWKIALPMARGRRVVCSAQPSYIEAATRTENGGVKVCNNSEEWAEAFENSLTGNSSEIDLEQISVAGTIMRYYSTSRVAQEHVSFLQQVTAATNRC